MKKRLWIIIGIAVVILLFLTGMIFLYYSTIGEELLSEELDGLYYQDFTVNGNKVRFIRNQVYEPDWESTEKDQFGFVGTLPDNEAEQIQQALDECQPIRTKWDALAFAKSFHKKLGTFGGNDIYLIRGFTYFKQSNQWRFIVYPISTIPDNQTDEINAVIGAGHLPFCIVVNGESMDYIYGYRYDLREIG